MEKSRCIGCPEFMDFCEGKYTYPCDDCVNDKQGLYEAWVSTPVCEGQEPPFDRAVPVDCGLDGLLWGDSEDAEVLKVGDKYYHVDSMPKVVNHEYHLLCNYPLPGMDHRDRLRYGAVTAGRDRCYRGFAILLSWVVLLAVCYLFGCAVRHGQQREFRQ